MFHHNKKTNSTTQQQQQQQYVVQPGQTVGGQTISTQPQVETLMHQTAVKEVIHPTQVEQVQPVVHRDIETTEIHQIQQPIYEKNVLPTQIQERILPTTSRPDVVMGTAPRMQEQQSTRQVLGTQASTVVLPPVVETVVHPHIVQEVQPIVYREVTAPTVIQEVQNINERVFQQPIVTQEIRQPIYQQQGQFQQQQGQQFVQQPYSQMPVYPHPGGVTQTPLGPIQNQPVGSNLAQPGVYQPGYTQTVAQQVYTSPTGRTSTSGSSGGIKGKLQNLMHPNRATDTTYHTYSQPLTTAGQPIVTGPVYDQTAYGQTGTGFNQAGTTGAPLYTQTAGAPGQVTETKVVTTTTTAPAGSTKPQI